MMKRRTALFGGTSKQHAGAVRGSIGNARIYARDALAWLRRRGGCEIAILNAAEARADAVAALTDAHWSGETRAIKTARKVDELTQRVVNSVAKQCAFGGRR